MAAVLEPSITPKVAWLGMVLPAGMAIAPDWQLPGFASLGFVSVLSTHGKGRRCKSSGRNTTTEARMYCCYCATELPDNAAFCFRCGKATAWISGTLSQTSAAELDSGDKAGRPVMSAPETIASWTVTCEVRIRRVFDSGILGPTYAAEAVAYLSSGIRVLGSINIKTWNWHEEGQWMNNDRLRGAVNTVSAQLVADGWSPSGSWEHGLPRFTRRLRDSDEPVRDLPGDTRPSVNVSDFLLPPPV